MSSRSHAPLGWFVERCGKELPACWAWADGTHVTFTANDSETERNRLNGTSETPTRPVLPC